MKVPPNLLVLLLVLSNGARGQLLFTSGNDTNQLLFERINGTTVQVPTGAGTHEWPGLSRGGRLVSFNSHQPDVTIFPAGELRAARTLRSREPKPS